VLGFVGVLGLALVCLVAVLVSTAHRRSDESFETLASNRITQLALEAHQAMLSEAIQREVGRS
jgi:hypothetical protein